MKDAQPGASVAPRGGSGVSQEASPVILIRGDNLAVMRALRRTHASRFTLAYLDPPFRTGRVHRTRDGKKAFDDRWSDRAAYLAALGERLSAVRELVAAHGSVVVHVDPRTSHYVKVLSDEVFGERAFASEIVWRYRRWPSQCDDFQRIHDVLLRYRKDPSVKPRWNQLYEPLAPSTVARWKNRRQTAIVSKDGRRLRSSVSSRRSLGVPLGDVWDMSALAPRSAERTGYPTQKPEALLERIVCALTDPGDLVLDPYAGSGTTLAVSARLGRHAIGIDSSAAAAKAIARRLGRGVAVERFARRSAA